MGFSLWGLAVSIAVLAPNLLMLWCPPRPPLRPVSVPWVVRVLERTGQGACAVVPVIAVPGEHLRWWWALPCAAAVVAYYLLWGRYLLVGRDPVSLYQRWGPIPIPMAITPISIFLAAALWLHTIWIAIAALVLAAGHIPTAAITARTNAIHQ